MGQRSIRRLNCIHGIWMYPDPEIGPEKLSLADVAARYASETEGELVTPNDFKSLKYKFEYENPEQEGMHGVPGIMHLHWKLRSRG